jgi:hypothetical protein
MTQPPDIKDKSEQVVNLVLRNLPLRRAPDTLAPRVLREMGRRAAHPFWKRGFSQWPPSARIAFAALCIVLVGLTLLDGSWAIVMRTVNDIGVSSMSRVQPMIAAIASARDLAQIFARMIPTAWLSIGIAAAGALYAALFGLGAVAYRVLYSPPSMAGDRS